MSGRGEEYVQNDQEVKGKEAREDERVAGKQERRGGRVGREDVGSGRK